MNSTGEPKRPWMVLARWCVYGCFFISGAASLIFEVLWSREFVTVFGNSAYAISIVLCAYMAGIGLGGILGGKLADWTGRHLLWLAGIETGVAAWALAVPGFMESFRVWVPSLPSLAAGSLAVSLTARFALSFGVLVVPCLLMGATFPLLLRAVTGSRQTIGRRLGALYAWNTLGAAFGCVAAGFWLLDTFGLRQTNWIAVCGTLFVALSALALPKPLTRPAGQVQAKADAERSSACNGVGTELSGRGMLTVAFLNGLAGLSCEVLWMRYLAFLGEDAYVFPTILCVYLVGLGAGGWMYSLMSRRAPSTGTLAIVQLLLAVCVATTFVAGATIFASGPPRPLSLKWLSLVTVSLPTVMMGVAFPMVCAMYGRDVQGLGGRVGLMLAVNTAGTMAGSLVPMFLLIPWFGIEGSLMLMAGLYAAVGAVLALKGRMLSQGRSRVALAVCVGVLVAAIFLSPADLCRRVFLATDLNLGRQTEILFYREGRTGTASVTRDRINGSKTVYINGISEVPASYAHEICFKMLGDLGPMLHPRPDEVLMICFGGGIAAGATSCLEEVKALTIVDLESSVVKAAALLDKENNRLLQNPKASVVIDDGRNFIMTSRRKWPVIVSDSTHPKSADSWVLYTREFYQLVREHLTDDGVFVEWLPRHGLRIAEFKIIARTFQSVFPHATLWMTQGVDARGSYISYALLVATSGPLVVDVGRLRERLGAPAVRNDLSPFGLDTPAGFLDAFVCGEDALRRWLGDGAINTDDLPYTQYTTRFTTGPYLGSLELLEPMEDVWPQLSGTGSPDESARFRDELNLHRRANRLACMGRWAEASQLVPGDVRWREMQRLYEGGSRYAQALVPLYWDNARGLVFAAELLAVSPAPITSTRPIYERVLQLDPDNVSALNMLGAMHSDGGDLQGARALLEKATRLKPDFDAAHFNLGLALDREGLPEAAREEYREAASLATDPRPADHWGSFLAREGRFEEAAGWFRKAVDLDPTFVTGRVHLAMALYRTGKVPEAFSQAEYILKLDPENKIAKDILAANR